MTLAGVGTGACGGVFDAEATAEFALLATPSFEELTCWHAVAPPTLTIAAIKMYCFNIIQFPIFKIAVPA
jgi:hypothetical protein